MSRENAWGILSMLGLLAIFTFLHFYHLTGQGLVGDEAAPILLIVRMYDGLRQQDLRFLAYPFLFYHDPYRALLSGTMFAITGVNLVWLRVPNIVFEIAGFLLLALTLEKRKGMGLLNTLVLAIYTTSGALMIGRLAGGDGQEKFLILLGAIMIYELATNKEVRRPALTVGATLAAIFTMLNGVVLLPSLIYFGIRSGNRRLWRMLFIAGALLAVYLVVWTAAPYIAYLKGWQEHYVNRGLFYYLSRVGEGRASDLMLGIRVLNYYGSVPLTGLLLAAWIYTWFDGKVRRINIITTPAWLAIFLLDRSSIHVVMFFCLFVWQMGIVGQRLWERAGWRKFIAVVLGIVIVMNTRQLLGNFFVPHKTIDEFPLGHIDMAAGRPVDEALLRLYEEGEKWYPTYK